MKETITDNNEISDIQLDKQKNKHILDSPDKIIRWIKHNFDVQRSKQKKFRPKSEYIDLSNCIISTQSDNGKPIITNLCDIIKENKTLSDCFINNEDGNNYHQEIKEIFKCENSIIYSAFFHGTKFHKKVDFSGTKFLGHAFFSHCFFEKEAYFDKTQYSGNFNFDNCIFNDSVLFKKAQFNLPKVNFQNTIFKTDFDAEGIEFNSDTKEHDNLKSKPFITFRNAQFNKFVNLSNINFTRSCFFNGAKFKGLVKFSNSNFRDLINFDSSQVIGHILFSININNQKNTKITSYNIIEKININRTKIIGRLDLENCNINKIEGFFANIEKNAILLHGVA